MIIAKHKDGSIKIPSGYFGNDKDNIFVKESFLQSDHLIKFQEYAPKAGDFDKTNDYWDGRIHNTPAMMNQNKEMFEILSNYYLPRVKREIELSFSVELQDNHPLMTVWRVGDYQPPHIDKADEPGGDGPYPGSDFGAIIYLNDNYEGGEIYFPNQSLTIKPKAGSLVYFPGDSCYPHGVKEIVSGVRYTLPTFWKAMRVL
jgi:predicted 2-oxoglutarate/Fe(II)-dependent dioxygenase YbiX